MSQSNENGRKGRGRPKVFNRDAALDKAMALFWQHGYEATSMAHLVEATGAKAPTLYAEFHNKEGLFRAVLERYICQFAAQQEAQLHCDDKPFATVLESYFIEVARCFTSRDTPSGCFMINTSSALAASSSEIADTIKTRHAQQARSLQNFLKDRQQRGEIAERCRIPELALWLNCVIQGMSVSAREGADFETLRGIIDTTFAILPALIQAEAG
ncbi:TetR family transcriptional regulator [Salmonella enterica subsp. enterica serovar Choleraesuis]|nr:TetR family transcriptional regulator [Salmonella enterica subsp. enterica serovar Choleraesuis]